MTPPRARLLPTSALVLLVALIVTSAAATSADSNAITGSTALPDRPFEVTELRVTSETAGPGDEVTITAVVANTGSESGALGIAL